MTQFLMPSTAKDLGFDYVMDKLQPVSPYGREAKEGMRPFLPGMEEELEEELDRLECFYNRYRENPGAFADIRALLAKLKEIRNSINKTAAGVLDDVELFEIKSFLFILHEISQLVLETGLGEIIELYPLPYLQRLFDPEDKGRRGFFIEDKYSEDLRDIRKKRRETERKIRSENAKLHSAFYQSFRTKLNPNGEIEVSKSSVKLMEKMKQSGLLMYSRENFATVTFAIKPTPRLEELNSQLASLKAEEDEEEQKIRKMLTAEVSMHKDVLMENINSLAILDLLIAKVCLAVGTKSVRPLITGKRAIMIKNGRHVLLEDILRQKGLEFIPVSINMHSPVSIITGANMGGKTVDLKLVGLLTVMAQYGLFVPADEMSLGLRRFIFFSGSFRESLTEGLSSFGAEIKAIGEVISHGPSEGLILIDELARGTNPPEAISIATALIERLMECSCLTLITTHFHQLTSIRGVSHFRVKGLANLNLESLSQEISCNFAEGVETLNRYMDYHLEEVEDQKDMPKDAIKVARIMGFDDEILDEAEKILAGICATDREVLTCQKN